MEFDLSPKEPSKVFSSDGGSYFSWSPDDLPMLSNGDIGAAKLELAERGLALPAYSDSAKIAYVLQDKVDRPISSAIYFLLPSGSKSFLHRLPCAETFHFYMGEPHTVFELHDNGQIKLTVLGHDLEAGHKLQYTVPPNVWFCSFPTLDIESFSADGSVLVKAPYRDPELYYSLVGVTCAPAFQFEDSETATFDDMIAIAPKAISFLKYLVRH